MGYTERYVTIKDLIGEHRAVQTRYNAAGRRVVHSPLCLTLYRSKSGHAVRIWSVWDVSIYHADGHLLRHSREINLLSGQFSSNPSLGCMVFRERTYTEGEHPYDYTCPLRYLAMVPPTSQTWRQRVIAIAEKKRPGAWARALARYASEQRKGLVACFG